MIIFLPLFFLLAGITAHAQSMDIGGNLGGDAFSISAPLTLTGSVLGINQAGTSSSGYLSSADWNTFNLKQSTALAAGDILVGNGSGIAAATIPGPDWVSIPAPIITDISGNGHNIPIATQAPFYNFTQAGIIGNSASSGSSISSIEVVPPLSSLTPANNISVSMWIKITSFVGIRDTLFFWGPQSGCTTAGHSLAVSSTGKLEYVVICGSSLVSTGSVSLNVWHHVVLTLDSSDNARVYLDGTLTLGPTNVNAGTTDGIGNDLIGAEYTSGTISKSFQGHLDEVGIWNTVISSSDVTSLYNAGAGIHPTALTTQTSNLLAAYSFEPFIYQNEVVSAGNGAITFGTNGAITSGNITSSGPIQGNELLTDTLYDSMGDEVADLSDNSNYDGGIFFPGLITAAGGISAPAGINVDSIYDSMGNFAIDLSDTGIYDGIPLFINGIIVNGSTSLDGGLIGTNGSGKLSVSSFTSFGQTTISSGAILEVDPGAYLQIDSSGSLIANSGATVRFANIANNQALLTGASGGTLTGLSPSTSGNVMTSNGSSWTSAVPSNIFSAIKNTAAQSTVSCSTSGSVVYSEPEQGSVYKKVLAYANACLGTASYTYPTAFSNTPTCVSTGGLACTLFSSTSTSAVTTTGTSSTGFLTLEGY